ncbi:hypothetical protein [Vibrio penaeicida]|uniref:DUF2987 domain-containing protein n=1 Tax=Vibrio penaeicida TaxID=104609 RepID=A0AAV5NKN3_9VIBR|nr:hypothetical protein [Vibrio penaeicida]RTZ24945.1 hypothetical protein EKN09_01350 [Vibrio penaeicida]GLQ71169.1 hypothetical protein GCM10007932_05290 [Vibrio penaeicida]
MLNFKPLVLLVLGTLLSTSCLAETVLLTGIIRFAEKINYNDKAQMRYVVEVDETAHNSWVRKYADVRVEMNDFANPLLFQKDDYLIVSGQPDATDGDILYSSLVHKTNAIEMSNDELLPIWMAYYRERLEVDLQRALDQFESTTIEMIYPTQFTFRLSKDHDAYTFVEYNRLKDHPLMPLIEFQMKRTMAGMDTLIPEIFFDFFKISIKDMKVTVERDKRTIS